MNPKDTSPPPGLPLADIYYVVFRHKWLIGAAFVVGLLAAAITYLTWPKVYESRAKLYVQYVLDEKAPNPLSRDATVRDLGADASAVINNELAILGSYDLALE